MADQVAAVLSDEEAYRLALKVSRKARGICSPNPPVGCVVLDKNKKLLATGHTQSPGGAHAEINALDKISDPKVLEGGHLFVTLEPCSHYGRTPPCADRIASLPLARVVYGIQDPFPEVQGNGLAKIRKAGIRVERIEGFERETELALEVFLKNQIWQTCFVSVKTATSLDGQIGLKNGESKWITGARAREHGHYLRSIHDAILVGVGTVLADNPSLDVRHGPHKGKRLKVVVLDPDGRSFPQLRESHLLKAHEKSDIYIVMAGEVENALGVQTLQCPTDGKNFDLRNLKLQLFEAGMSSVYVEGGALTASQFFAQGQVDRVYHFLATSYVGAGNGKAFTEALSIEQLEEKIELSDQQLKVLDKDLLISGRVL